MGFFPPCNFNPCPRSPGQANMPYLGGGGDSCSYGHVSLNDALLYPTQLNLHPEKHAYENGDEEKNGQ